MCFLPGKIDQLAYISPHEYRFDERARSVVCTVSSDCTVRAWDLREVNCSLGREGSLLGLIVLMQSRSPVLQMRSLSSAISCHQ